MISDWTGQRTANEVLEVMREASVPAGKLFTAEDMLSDEHYAARENVVEVEDPEIGPFPMQNVVPRLSETPGKVRWTGPTLGQHNDEVYGERTGTGRRGAGRVAREGHRLMRVEIVDVGPRDGLQNEDETLAPAVRAELCDRLAAAGVPRVEAASFVNPKRVPQMAGAEEVVAALDRRPGTVYAGLVLNERGYERAVEAGVDEVRYAFPVTETFAGRNQNTTVEAATVLAGRLVERARLDGVRVSITLSAAFGDPFEGRVEPAHVLRVAERVADPAPDEIVLADTIGVGVPSQVRELVGGALAYGRDRRLPLPRHPQHRDRERGGRRRGGRDGARRVRRWDGRVPLRAPGDRQHRDRRPRLRYCTAWATRRE